MSWIRERILNWFKLLAMKVLSTSHVPRHVAFIMDGNRRYANKQNMAKEEGHVKGFDKLSETVDWFLSLGITEVTVYAFSIENFKRSKEEVDRLMELAKQKFELLVEEKDKLKEKGVRVRVIGNLSLLPKDLRELIAEAMNVTKNNNKLVLNVAFAYTSKDEMTQAIKDIAKGVKSADIQPEDVSEDLISDCLYTYSSSNPDLLIRTSGEMRLSDFLMWQTSNTCLYFTNALWPKFSMWHFLNALLYYQRCYPDLQRLSKMQQQQNSKAIAHRNNRVSMYIDKLHREREIFLLR